MALQIWVVLGLLLTLFMCAFHWKASRATYFMLGFVDSGSMLSFLLVVPLMIAYENRATL